MVIVRVAHPHCRVGAPESCLSSLACMHCAALRQTWHWATTGQENGCRLSHLERGLQERLPRRARRIHSVITELGYPAQLESIQIRFLATDIQCHHRHAADGRYSPLRFVFVLFRTADFLSSSTVPPPGPIFPALPFVPCPFFQRGYNLSRLV